MNNKVLTYAIVGAIGDYEALTVRLSVSNLSLALPWHTSFSKICDRLGLSRVETDFKTFSQKVAEAYNSTYDFRLHTGGSECLRRVCGFVINERLDKEVVWRSICPDVWIYIRKKKANEKSIELKRRLDDMCVKSLVLVQEDDLLLRPSNTITRISKLLSRSIV